MSEPVQLLVGARKGAWILQSDAARADWRVRGPLFIGHDETRDVAQTLSASDELLIFGALSGG